MAPSPKERQMLEQLIGLKKRREDRLLRELAKNQEAIDANLQHQEETKGAISANRSAWKEANQQGVSGKKQKLDLVLKQSYNSYFEEDQALRGQGLKLEEEKKDLQKQREDLNLELKKARVGQEKLKYVLERMHEPAR